MEFYEVINTRRSIRLYKKDKVPEEALICILEAARIAPSGHNRQFWKFYIVKNEDRKLKVAEACGGQKWIADAPIVVVAVGWKVPFSRGGYMGEMSFIMDVSIAFTQLILAARAEGLGTCWIGDFQNKEVKEALELPDDENVVAVTPLGYPDKGVFNENTSRKPLAEIVEEM
ncbi:MAG: nitroreductase family protein [Candidatus Bathyarchaeota archaeon]|nr:nitroreductase family protein [Candidatus Bathyarchaeota archaeon]